MVETLTDLAELRRLEREATPGPWMYTDISGFVFSDTAGALLQTWNKLEEDFPNADNDGRLTAAMRNALPGLLDELERLRLAQNAASDLDTKLRMVSEHENYKAVWMSAWVHGVKYSGPNYGEEQERLTAAMTGIARADIDIAAARAHLLDAIASMQPEGDHQPMQSVRAALAALEGRPQARRPEESA